MNAPAKKSLYEILGVGPRATPEEIAAAYERRRSQVDAAPTPDTGLKMALREAHAVLSNPQRRAVYDNSLKGRETRALNQARQAQREEERSGLGKAPVVVLGLVLLVGGGWWLAKRSSQAEPVRAQVQRLDPRAASAPVAEGPTLSPEQLYAKVSQSIVRINVLRRDGTPVALGSGVVIDTDTVITNCHVALDGDTVQVREDNKDALPATVTVADEEFDLCKLRVSGLTKKPAQISSARVAVGQKVFAIGSPRGLDMTLSDGLVSSLREGPAGQYIQTTAPVSPGSSGGGLFDQRGRLVGIITFQVRGGQNLNFALPVEWFDKMTTRRAANASAAGQVDRALLGSWRCYGPMTGRGLDLTLNPGGTFTGSMDGMPVDGQYTVVNGVLTIISQGEETPFAIEELNAQRLVLGRGEGRRIVCNR